MRAGRDGVEGEGRLYVYVVVKRAGGGGGINRGTKVTRWTSSLKLVGAIHEGGPACVTLKKEPLVQN